ncbi:MAG: alpha/beta hydrolase [Bacteroidota bacterium]
MSKKLIYILSPVLVLILVYALGPSPTTPKWSKEMPIVPENPEELEAYIANQEGKHKIKPDNEARIVWFDSLKRKTEYSVIYLHGYSASQEEGDPVHQDFAKKFGCNLYLARMADHGIDTVEQLLYFTPDRWWQSSKEALAIGKAIGEKVIVMSTSTGGTMALTLASSYPDDVTALINMSPNIAINNPTAWILNKPWGLQIARMVTGSLYGDTTAIPGVDPELSEKYGYNKCRLESACQLQEMVTSKMNEKTFSKVTQPSITLYYYKNEEEQDPTVKVSAILDMNDKLGTPDNLKEAVPVPGAGTHVIGCYFRSHDVPAVQSAIQKFALDKLKMRLAAEL